MPSSAFPSVASSLRRFVALLLLILLPAPCPAQTTRPAEELDPTRGTRVTLSLKDVPAEKAFIEFGKASGMVLAPYPPTMWQNDPGPKITGEWKDASYWTVLRELCDQGGVTLQRIGMGRDPVIMKAGARGFEGYPFHEHGPFLVCAQSVYRTNVVELWRTRDASRTCSVRLALYAEPRILVVQANSTATIDKAENEQGKPLVLAAAQSPVYSQGWMWSVNISFSLPEDPGQRIALLKGRVPLQAVSKSATVVLDGIMEAKDATAEVEGRKLIVRSVKEQGTSCNMELEVEFPESAGDLSRMNDLSSFFRLEDAEGLPLTRRSIMRNTWSGRTAKLTLGFARETWAGAKTPGKAQRLLWYVPLELRSIEVPFEFRDLPLP